MRKIKSNKTVRGKFIPRYLAVACALVLSNGTGLVENAIANAILYQANSANAVTGVMGLNKTNLNSTALNAPATLLTGPNNFNYIVLLFRPTETATYIFGQTAAPVDTVMIFYQDRFDVANPGTGALVGNDDMLATKHQSVPGLGSTTINCGGNDSRCPQITYDLASGRVYTILISTYTPNAALPLPQSFYSSGPGDFGSFNNLKPIDTTASYFLVYDLDFTVKPQFSGGILRIDQVGQAYSTAFTLSNLAGNTLDEYNNHVVLSGVFSDLVVGQPGVLTLVNTLGTNGSVTLSGTNTFTGGLTLGTNSLLHISNDRNLGATAAKLTFNGGTLNPTAAVTSARTVTLQSGGGTIDTNVNTTLTGVISGAGGLIKKGTGTLILGGNNNYTGDTTISAGTLQIGNGATTGSIVGDIINNSRLVFNHSNTHIHAGEISGTGSLTQAGTAASVTVLTADNSYTGGTTISSGALRIGNGGNTGSVVGNILNNASLIFNRSGSYTYSGVVSGTGSLTQAGAAGSVTTLSNTNNYTGGTTISSGTLKIGAGGSTGSVTGNILNNSALVFDRSDELIYSGIVSGTGSLTQTGAGTLSLAGVNSYSGPTLVESGVLKTNVANAFANSSSVTVNSGTTLNLNNFAQVANNLTGSGSVLLGSAVLTENSTTNSTFSGGISGTGSLIKTGTSQLTLSGTSNYSGGTTINAGTLSLTSGTAAGSGAVTTNTGALNLNFASDSTLANQLLGTGPVSKTGVGTATLTGASSSVGNVTVSAGGLELNQNGAFRAANYTTQANATTSISNTTQLISTGAFTQSADSILNVDVGTAPTITAQTAVLDGTLNLSGLSISTLLNAPTTIIHTINGITGDFSSVSFGGASSTVDYLTLAGSVSDNLLDYDVALGLTWQADPADAHGDFTLSDTTDSFDVDVVLADRTGPFDSGWNGRDLTKEGLGTLTLSAVNTYTGATAINAGTLQAGIANAFAQSSAVAVGADATLALNNFAQTANNLSGSGDITLGTAALTANNSSNTAFSGGISGTGRVIKSGTGTLTLSGTNGYSGGTTLSAGGLVLTSGAAAGSGAVTNSGGILDLNFATNSTLANQLLGTGALQKTAAGTATLTGAASSAGNVTVSAGGLTLGQTGAFTAANYTTQTGATTSLASSAQLNSSGIFTQATGSTLNVALGSGLPISADTAALNGALNISGLSGPLALASTLLSAPTTIIHTTNGISGDFSSVSFGGVSSPLDYLTLAGSISTDLLDYNVGFGLTWLAALAEAHGDFTLGAATDSFNVDVVLADRTGPFDSGWNGRDLTKNGLGTLTLSAVNTYTGATAINAGTLQAGIANAFAQSSAVSLGANTTLALNNFAQTANNLSGSGDITLGTAALTANNSSNTAFSGGISGTGQLIKSGTGTLTLSGTNGYSGGTTLSAGGLVLTSGAAVGSGAVTNSGGILDLNFATNSTLANQLLGTGALQKTGAGTATLTGASSAAGNVTVSAGGLTLGQTGPFTAANYTTQTGATTSLASSAQLNNSGIFTQATGSTLNVALGSGSPITADTAALNGALNISGLSGPFALASTLLSAPTTIIHTTNGISGDFSSVSFGGVSSPVDYLTLAGSISTDLLDYNVGFGLTWLAALAEAHGDFTLGAATDSFNVDLVLADRTGPFDSGWNGRDLTKEGLGTLTLSAVNTYTGATAINAGTLQAGIANAFAQSSAVSLGANTTLALNNFAQTANNLSGSGDITLGTVALTANNSSNTAFSGGISGTGQLIKSGTGTLTLSGTNGYSGGTTLSAGGLVLTSGAAVGSGAVTNSGGILDLNFASDSTLANQLLGTGALQKTGAGTATLTGASSAAGNVTVSAGGLTLGQTGAFTAANYTTQTGATTSLAATAQLNSSGIFTQATGSTLNVALGSASPITADSAVLSGALNISGLSGPFALASALISAPTTIIHTNTGIGGDFTSLSFGGVSSPVDYLTLAGSVSADLLDYNVGFGLSWLAVPADARGDFTLSDATDSFNVDLVLADRTGPFDSGWNGRDLTKEGLGTLILSAVNTYTGATAINAGTLQAGIANAFAESTSVVLGADGTLDLNNFAQTANNLSGSGDIALGSAVLTANNSSNTDFSGGISGTGQVIKSGTGTLTLSGASGYSGGTNIQEGELIVTDGEALGTGTVTNDTMLNLDFNTDATFANTILGQGEVFKTGTAELTLTGENTLVDTLRVQEGTLILGATGDLSAAHYQTNSDATTVIGGNTKLVVEKEFIQDADSTFVLNIGAFDEYSVTAGSAELDGTLIVSGFVEKDEPITATAATTQGYTFLHTTGGIQGKFNNNPLIPTGLDYLLHDGHLINGDLDYELDFRLAWTQGYQEGGTGHFTLGANTAFDVDLPLADQNVPAGGFDSNWDGKSLIKNGAGRLILSEKNLYTGTTTVNKGILQLSAVDSIASSSEVLVSDGILDLNGNDQKFNRLAGDGGEVTLNGATLTVINPTTNDDTIYKGAVSGPGSFIKSGLGSLTLAGATTWTGSTELQSGSLILDGSNGGAQLTSNVIGQNGSAFNLLNGAHLTGAIDTSNVSIDSVSQWLVTDNSQVTGLTNSGRVEFEAPTTGNFKTLTVNGNFKTLTVNGNYQGDEGLLVFNGQLAGDASPIDKMVVTGDTSGVTYVEVNNVGGSGAAVLNGIELITVGGQSDGIFVQTGRIAAGPYEYYLVPGTTSTEPKNWYLTNVNTIWLMERPEASSYAANLATANNLFVTRLQDRQGERQYVDLLTGELKTSSMWLRSHSSHNRSRDGFDQLRTLTNSYMVQLGGEFANWYSDSGHGFHLGLMAGYGSSKSRTNSRLSGYQARASMDGYSTGLYGTWYSNEAQKTGLYVDGWVQYGWFDNTVDGHQLSSEQYKSSGVTASIESGYTMKLMENKARNFSAFIQPQAQVTWMGVKADDHQEANGTRVSGEGDGNIQTRLGMKFFLNGQRDQDEGKNRIFQPFVTTSWLYNSKAFGSRMDGVVIKQDGASNIAELKIGVEGQLSKSMELWGNVGQQVGRGGYSDTSVVLGVKYKF